MCILCARRIYFYFIDVRPGPRVGVSWRSAHPYFFENRRRVLPRAESSAERIEVGAADKRENRLKKPNFHVAVKHSGSRSEQDPRFCCPLQLAFLTLQWSPGRLTAAQIGAVISRPPRNAIYSRKRSPSSFPRLEAQLIANRYSWIYVSRNYNEGFLRGISIDCQRSVDSWNCAYSSNNGRLWIPLLDIVCPVDYFALVKPGLVSGISLNIYTLRSYQCYRTNININEYLRTHPLIPTSIYMENNYDKWSNSSTKVHVPNVQRFNSRCSSSKIFRRLLALSFLNSRESLASPASPVRGAQEETKKFGSVSAMNSNFFLCTALVSDRRTPTTFFFSSELSRIRARDKTYNL